MNVPDPPAPTASLTPEERDLAQRLQRLGGQREPSAGLDARILAAARAAERVPASSRRRAPRRWPVALGLAASMVGAVGIAWQLRSLPEAGVGYSEVPTTAPATDAANAAGETAAAGARMVPQAESAAAAPPSMEVPQGEAGVQRQEARPEATRADSADAGAFTAEPAEPAIVFDDPAPMDAAAPTSAPSPAPAPPPPAAPAAVTAFPAPAAAPMGAAAAQSKQAVEPKARARGIAAESDAAREAEAASALDRIEVTGSRIANDQPFDEQPPASADSPQVQQAWLQRIRELLARGEVDAARASLAEYRRRYPLQALPDDLRALEE